MQANVSRQSFLRQFRCRPPLCVLLLICGSLFAYRTFAPHPTRPVFDAEVWRKNAGKDREAMLFDLIGNGKLIGLTTAEVESMLGAPDEKGRNHFYYGLPQVQFGWGTYVDTLRVTFDDDGKVIEAGVPEL